MIMLYFIMCLSYAALLLSCGFAYQAHKYNDYRITAAFVLWFGVFISLQFTIFILDFHEALQRLCLGR